MLEPNQQQQQQDSLVASNNSPTTPPQSIKSSKTNSNIDLANIVENELQQADSSQQQTSATTLSPKIVENLSNFLKAGGNSADVQMYANLLQQLQLAASTNTSPQQQQPQQPRSSSSSPPQQQQQQQQQLNNNIIGNNRTSPLNTSALAAAVSATSADFFNTHAAATTTPTSGTNNNAYWNEIDNQQQQQINNIIHQTSPTNSTLSALQQQFSMLSTSNTNQNVNMSPMNVNSLTLLQQQLILQQQQQQQNLMTQQLASQSKRPITGNKTTSATTNQSMVGTNVSNSSTTSTNGSGNTNNSNSASQKTSPTSSNSLSNVAGLANSSNWNQQWPVTQSNNQQQQQQQAKQSTKQLSTTPSTSLQQLNSLSSANYLNSMQPQQQQQQQQQPTTPKLNTSQSLTNASIMNKQRQQQGFQPQQQQQQQQQPQSSSISGLLQQRHNLLSSSNYDLDELQNGLANSGGNSNGAYDLSSLNSHLIDLYRSDPIQFDQLMKLKGIFGTNGGNIATGGNMASASVLSGNSIDEQNLLMDEIPHLDQTVPANMLNNYGLNRGSPRNSQNMSLQQQLAQQQLYQLQQQQQQLHQHQQQQQLNNINNNMHPSMLAAAANMNQMGLHGQEFREERFSRKVFVGGLPPDIDEEEIVTHFRRYGNLIVDWPHKAESKSYFPPKGYAFLIFQEERSVQDLIDQCVLDDGKLYMVVSSPSMKDKPVQIRPWCLADSDFVMDGSQPLDPRKTIFVGGVPRPLKAIELAMIMDRFYGGVCYAGIDTDPELKYPKGAGRVAFSNQQSYIAAISARFVQLQHGEIDKRVMSYYFPKETSCNFYLF